MLFLAEGLRDAVAWQALAMLNCCFKLSGDYANEPAEPAWLNPGEGPHTGPAKEAGD